MTLRNISCGCLDSEISLQTTASIQNQPAARTGWNKTSSSGKSLYGILSSNIFTTGIMQIIKVSIKILGVVRTAVNKPRHSDSRFSNWGWRMGAVFYYIFLIIFFGTLGELHVHNRCQIRHPQKLNAYTHPELRFSTSSIRISFPTVPQMCFSILNLKIPLLGCKAFPTKYQFCLWKKIPKKEKLQLQQ